MIPFASLALKGKSLAIRSIAVAVVLALALAWGGIGWWGKAGVERDFAEYRGEQARLVARQRVRLTPSCLPLHPVQVIF